MSVRYYSAKVLAPSVAMACASVGNGVLDCQFVRLGGEGWILRVLMAAMREVSKVGSR